jgi:hypothetical protein
MRPMSRATHGYLMTAAGLTNIRRQNLALKPKGSGRAAGLKTLCVMPTSA